MAKIGYEVLRNGQGYSTRNPISGDIPLKVIKGYQGSSSRRQSVISLREQSRIREEEALKKAAQQKAIDNANKEAARIETLRNSLIASGARKSVITRRNAAGKEISKIITYQNNVNKVVTSQNLLDGSSSSKTYRYNRLSGGVGTTGQTASDVSKIKQSLYSVGATPIIRNGQVTGYYYNKTAYSYTDKNLKILNKNITAKAKAAKYADLIKKLKPDTSTITKDRSKFYENYEKYASKANKVLSKYDLEKSTSNFEKARKIYMTLNTFLPSGIGQINKYSKAYYASVGKNLINSSVGFLVLTEILLTKQLRQEAIGSATKFIGSAATLVSTPEGRLLIKEGVATYASENMKGDLEKLGKYVYENPEKAAGKATALLLEIGLTRSLTNKIGQLNKKILIKLSPKNKIMVNKANKLLKKQGWVSNKKIKTSSQLDDVIKKLEKLRQGKLNAIYLKAKNAQFADKTFGTVKSIGTGKQVPVKTLKKLVNSVSNKGITTAQLSSGSYYVQSIKIASDEPLLKVFIANLKRVSKGKKILNVKGIPKFYEFKRYGIVTSRLDNGVAKAFAIEFNRVGGVVSHISFKTGVSVDKYPLVKLYNKVKAVKGSGIRVRLKDIYVSKDKLISTTKASKNVVKTINSLENKKVLIEGIPLKKRQILNLKSAIIDDFRLGSNKNAGTFIKKLYKNNIISGKSGVTNTVRFEKTSGDVIKIVLKSKKSVGLRFSNKGDFFELAVSKFKIPTSIAPKKIFTIGKSVKAKTTINKNIEKAIRIVKTKTVNNKIPSKLKLVSKQSLNTKQIQTLERSIKNVQQITKPIMRSSKLSKPLGVVKTRTIVRSLSIVIPLLSIKSAMKLNQISSTLQKLETITSLKSLSALQLKSITSLQSVLVTPLKTISIILPTIISRPSGIPTTKKIPSKIIIPLVSTKRITTKKSNRKKPTKQYGYKTAKLYNNRLSTLNELPLSKERAFDLVAYSLLKSRSVSGKIKKSSKKVTLRTLNRSPSNIPAGYFKRNRNKFVLRKLKTNQESYEIRKKRKV